MTGRLWRRIGFCLALAALAGCGIKGEPTVPGSEAQASEG
jgi:hypothetical protein